MVKRKHQKRFVPTLPKIDEDSRFKLFKEIVKVFETAQLKFSCHERCLRLLQNIFDQHEPDDFLETFLNCLETPIEFDGTNDKVARTIDFAAKFCASFGKISTGDNNDDGSDNEYQIHPFLLAIFQFALKYHNSNRHVFRYRACQFISKLLVHLGEHAELDDKLCDDILHAMLSRLKDPKYKVRTQAIFALHRLQNPTDVEDQVTKAYLFHLESDPNPQVRRAVVNNLVRSTRGFSAVVTRIQDVDESVRHYAYNYLSMNIDLLNGMIFDATVENLEKRIEGSELLWEIFFEKHSVDQLIGALGFSENKLIELDSLNYGKFSYWRCLCKHFLKQGSNGVDYLKSILPELTEFCSYIKKYVYKMRNKERDEWEEIPHQAILRQLFDMIECFDLSEEVGRSNLSQLTIGLLVKEKLIFPVIEIMIKILEKLNPNVNLRIQQIFRLITVITGPLQVHEIQLIDDEKRRKEVKIDELRSKIKCLTVEEKKAVSKREYMEADELKEEIKKLNDMMAAPVPVKKVRVKSNDEENTVKALDIVISMLQSSSVTEYTPEIRNLQQNLISDNCLQSNIPPHIESRALRCLALCALLDENLAFSVMPKFYYRVMAYKFQAMLHVDILKISLSAIIELFLLYGLNKFNKFSEADTTNTTLTGQDVAKNNTTALPVLQAGPGSNEIISYISSFLDNENPEIRSITADGLCRLIVCEKLQSTDILRRLIILLFNPATENDVELRQRLGVMFNNYTQHKVGAQEELAKVFFPTLRTILDAPDSSPLAQIKIQKIISFLLMHTQPGRSKVDSINIHNQLALGVCQEFVKNIDSLENIYYINCLPELHISEDDTNFRNDLLTFCNQIITETKYKLYAYWVQKFIAKLQNKDTNIEDDNDVERKSISYPDQSDDRIKLSIPVPFADLGDVKIDDDDNIDFSELEINSDLDLSFSDTDSEEELKTPQNPIIRRNLRKRL